MRQVHKAGEKLFVDYPGQTIPITDPLTGEITQAEVFVAVLGASNYTYAEAFPSQELPHWIAGHVHAFEHMGVVPQILVPDNLRSGVTKAHRYEPEVNRTYQEMASHYGVAVIPARARKPRDKAKVEAGVLIVERWILARLRNQTFFSLAELNFAIRALLVWLNDRPFKKLPGTRRSLFEDLDRPAMRPLPALPYEYATFKWGTVGVDYHVEVDRHWYSVPYQLARQRCEVRLTANVVEVIHRGRRVASHARSFRPHRHTTLPEHMPAGHRQHLEWTPERILSWARATGPKTAEFVDSILRSRTHPQQGFRSCLGILRLAKRYPDERVEAASARALAIGALGYRSFESILRSGLDRQPIPGQLLPGHEPAALPRQHENLRGAAYYN
jgi:transposase